MHTALRKCCRRKCAGLDIDKHAAQHPTLPPWVPCNRGCLHKQMQCCSLNATELPPTSPLISAFMVCLALLGTSTTLPQQRTLAIALCVVKAWLCCFWKGETCLPVHLLYSLHGSFWVVPGLGIAL